MKSWWKVGLAVAFLVALAVGIPAAIAQQIPNPDTLIEATAGDTDTLDPIHAYDTASGEIIFQIYENLIRYKGPSVKEFEPELATKWEVSPDGMTYTFTIRSGVTFHEGGVLTPEDVEYSFERIMIHSHPDSPAWIILEDLLGVYDLQELADAGKSDAEICQMVQNAVTVEGDKVIFHLAAPSATFLARIAHGASWGAIEDKEWVIAQGGWPGTCDNWRDYYYVEKENLPLHTKANGTGPFKLERWTPEVETVLVANDTYWAGAIQKVRRVVRQVVNEYSTRKLMLEKGDADIIYVPRQYTHEVEGTPGVRTIKYLPQLVNEAVFFNYDIVVEGNPNIGSGKLDGQGIPGDFFTDIHVRKGFNYCFDWDRFITEVYLGEAAQSHGPIPSSLPYFNPAQETYHFDPEQAASELKQAWGGQLWANGMKFTLLYNTGNEMRRVAAEIIESCIESLNPNFSVEVRGEPWPTYLDNFRGRRLPLWIIGWLADFPDPHNFVHPYMHSHGAFAYRQRLSKIANYDELIEAAAKEVNPARRQQLYFELQKKAYEDAIDIFLDDSLGRNWQRCWVDGYSYNPMWPGLNYYILGKKAGGRPQIELIQSVYPGVQMDEWCE
jgi:peptide/nickel transport system substrate-binding protein